MQSTRSPLKIRARGANTMIQVPWKTVGKVAYRLGEERVTHMALRSKEIVKIFVLDPEQQLTAVAVSNHSTGALSNLVMILIRHQGTAQHALFEFRLGSNKKESPARLRGRWTWRRSPGML